MLLPGCDGGNDEISGRSPRHTARPLQEVLMVHDVATKGNTLRSARHPLTVASLGSVTAERPTRAGDPPETQRTRTEACPERDGALSNHPVIGRHYPIRAWS